MVPGAVIAGRFKVERRVAAGGMGDVYLALDLEHPQQVALKILRWHSEQLDVRFEREAAVLARLQHPGIVRYIAHGLMDDGNGYLAMEWIEGELLSERLRRGPLAIASAIGVLTRIAEALAEAHLRHIVHRDLKPRNLICAGGALEAVKILDFGLARDSVSSQLVITRTGELGGTPGYMAPEQARGLHDVDARADVYSLGCVLFECLTGAPVFAANHALAVLAKIIVQEPPRVAELRPEVPPALDHLVTRMLAKDPAERPADAAALITALEWATAAPPDATPPAGRGLGRREQRVLAVVLAAGGGDADSELASTLVATAPLAPARALTDEIAAFGGALERLAGGDLVITLHRADSTIDLAARAARCALAVAAHLPDKQIAVATGRGLAHARVPLGQAIDSAASLIARAASVPIDSASEPGPGEPGPSEPRPGEPGRTEPLPPRPAAPRQWLPIRLDEVTAGLLDSRFDIGADEAGHVLLGFAEHREAARTLLGKVTPFVGRQRELASLFGILDESLAEPRAQAVLVIGPAGAGKSRLRAELLRRAQDDHADLQVWMGRADPVSAGAPLSMLAQIIRREAGIGHREDLGSARRKLSARVRRHLSGDDADRVSAFLGEICGVRFRDDDHPLLRAARSDASVMGDQMQAAWLDLVAAECATGGVLLVLEDLHWGDLPTVRFVDAALRVHADRPLMVLALARPDVAATFPDLWSERKVERVTLRPLGDRAARKVVVEMLGDATPDDVVARIVAQAGGNPFFLEELIRGASTGHDSPGTVLAVIAGHLERLPGEQRRLLRVASILGDTFWPDPLPELAGSSAVWVRRTLAQLVDAEWLICRELTAGAVDIEYSFRHALVREAAHAMLTDDDRRLGHRLAAEWLARRDDADAMTVAEHFERGDDPARAVPWYTRAARRALDGTDLRAAIERARRGLACAGAATPEEVGELRAVLAEAYTWNGENAEAEADGLAALDLLPVGGSPWFAAAAQVARAAGRLSHYDRLVSLGRSLRDAPVEPALAAAWLNAASPAADMLIFSGADNALADALIARMEALEAAACAIDPAAPAIVRTARALRAGSRGDAAASLAERAAAAGTFDRLGQDRRAAVQRFALGYDCILLGAWERGEAELRRVLVDADRLAMPRLRAIGRHKLGLLRAYQGALAEAATLERQAMAELAAQGDRRSQAACEQYLGFILLLAGDLDAAAAAVQRALELEPQPGPARTHALGLVATLHLQQGRVADAVTVAREAMAEVGRLGGIVDGEADVRLVLAEALHAAGELAAARDAITAAASRLHEVAARIGDPALRASFLSRVPANARTLALARAWSPGG